MLPPLVSHSRRELRLAPSIGSGGELREALARLEARLGRGAVTVLGPLAPDAALCEAYRGRGVLEGSPGEFRAATRTVVVPPTGLPKLLRRRWKESGHELLDLTLPAVRRAQTSLHLLAMEQARPVVVGHRDDAECAAIAGEVAGSVVVEDADQAARLPFAPKFGVVCQTLLSRRRAAAVVEALRQRHPDSRVTFLDTTSPALSECERSVEALSRWAEGILIAGEAGEASVRALIEASRRLGLPARAVADAAALDFRDFAGAARIGIAAGFYGAETGFAALAARLTGGEE
jgi:4-hydroxy-3-methylbut-2-enyl diphosphate reductase